MSNIKTGAPARANRKPWMVPLAVLLSFPLHQARADENPTVLAPISVTASPIDTDAPAAPAAVLGGRELSLARESTLGETLKNLPGVSASGFGPNASRPVMRGLDGERVRITQNGTGILDASSLSFDHAVAIDPLVIEQIDVVRGPAALLYGGSAAGGVVNATDYRIPRERLDGITGRGELRLGGAANQKNGAVVLDAGSGALAIHGDVYERNSDDLDIPGHAVSARKSRLDGTPRGSNGRLRNSAARGDGGALGASLVFDHGYAGLSYASYNNKYGTVAEEDVVIDQNSKRWDFASELDDLGGPVERVKLRLSHTDYAHVEIAGGTPETRFSNRGLEGALEVGHGGIGRLAGTLGLRFQNARFQALGAEAFVPGNRTRSRGIYLYEALPLDLFAPNDAKLSLGGRLDRVDVDSSGDGDFGAPMSRGFTPGSLAAGAWLRLDGQWSISANLSHDERAPSYFELYANGPHVATGQFEVGRADFDEERSNGVDVRLDWRSGRNSLSVSAYRTRFDNFIGLFDSGTAIEVEPGEFLPEARFGQVRAIFSGIEAEGKFRIHESRGTLDLTVRGDYVRARNRDTGGNLPRIAPLRLGFGLNYARDRFTSRLDVLHAFRQNRTDAFELPTDGYTSVNATLTYLLPTTRHLEAFARADNLLNEEIRDHASFLKDIAPQGGRSLLIGLRGEF